MSLQDWLSRYFIEGYGYNPVNTTVYGFLLIFFAYIVFKILKKLRIDIDERLALAISPFILFGSSTRVLEDMGVLSGFLFITPGIYFITFGLTFITLLISSFIQKKFDITYYKIMFIVGLLLVTPILGILNYKNFTGILYVLLYFVPWIILLKIIPWLRENKIITGIHTFDGTVTFVSLNYFGYYEQHVLPRYLIALFGNPFSFVVLKFIVVGLTLFIIDRYSEEGEFKNYIKLIIGILGAATGIRDFLRLFSLA